MSDNETMAKQHNERLFKQFERTQKFILDTMQSQVEALHKQNRALHERYWEAVDLHESLLDSGHARDLGRRSSAAQKILWQAKLNAMVRKVEELGLGDQEKAELLRVLQTVLDGIMQGYKEGLAGKASDVPPLREPVPTGLPWFDEIAGGGLVPGGVYVLSGAAGVGKTTLLMQVMDSYVRDDRHGLYISGDESAEVLAHRAMRLGFSAMDDVSLCSTRDTGEALWAIENASLAAPSIGPVKVSLVVVDAIQDIGDKLLDCDRPGKVAAPFGSSQQVDNLMKCCIEEAKKIGAAIVFVDRAGAKGAAAGGMRAQHMADAHLLLERRPNGHILSLAKHRFGPRSGSVVVELGKRGFKPV